MYKIKLDSFLSSKAISPFLFLFGAILIQQPSSADSGTKIAASLWHTCAVTPTGGVKCWGSNSWGQLGDGTKITRNTAVDVQGLTSGVKAVGVGTYSSCALLISGQVKCWGYNNYGQLGYGSNLIYGSATPVDVVQQSGPATAIAVGANHACLLDGYGSVFCWGDNQFGQLNNSLTIKSKSVPIYAGVGNVTAIAGTELHMCAVTSSRGVKCFGSNSYGQLGNGTKIASIGKAVDVIGLSSGVLTVGAGSYNSCAVTITGAVKCWGSNPAPWGLFGVPSPYSSYVPIDISTLSAGITAFTSGKYHSCVLTTSGKAQCFGNNGYGQLGNGITGTTGLPSNVINITGDVTAIAEGSFHTCALVSGGGAKCWGRNAGGYLGNGQTIDSYIPTAVIGF